jgi:hypothetical protein
MWPDPGTYINCSHRHMNVEIGTEAAHVIPRKGIHKSVDRGAHVFSKDFPECGGTGKGTGPKSGDMCGGFSSDSSATTEK